MIDLNTGSEEFKDHKLLFINKLNEIETISRAAIKAIEETDSEVLDLKIKQVTLESELSSFTKFSKAVLGFVIAGLLSVVGWLIKVYVLEK